MTTDLVPTDGARIFQINRALVSLFRFDQLREIAFNFPDQVLFSLRAWIRDDQSRIDDTCHRREWRLDLGAPFFQNCKFSNLINNERILFIDSAVSQGLCLSPDAAGTQNPKCLALISHSRSRYAVPSHELNLDIFGRLKNVTKRCQFWRRIYEE